MTISRLPLAELAALVCSTFQKHGITTILTGGSCVTLYSEGKYVSKDIDLVLTATSDINSAYSTVVNPSLSIHNDLSMLIAFLV